LLYRLDTFFSLLNTFIVLLVKINGSNKSSQSIGFAADWTAGVLGWWFW